MRKKQRGKSAARYAWRRPNMLMWSFVLLLILAACRKQETHQDTYTCPMHPTVVAQRPGVCPVCGMDLVRKARPGEAVKITEDLQALLESPARSVVSQVKTLRV